MKLIESKTLGTAAASIEFTSIPQTFTDLVLLVSGRTTGGAGECWLRFNGDSGTNYSWRRLLGTGSAASSDSQASYGGYNTFLYFPTMATRGTYTANTFGSGMIYIPNYAGSTTKSASMDGVSENNATAAQQELIAGLWNSTAAITSILLDIQTDSYETGTVASLYGVLKGSDGIVTTS